MQEVIGFIVAVDKLITHATGDAAASLSLIYIYIFLLLAIREKSTNEKENQREEKQPDNLSILYRLKYATICTMIHLDYSPLVQQSQNFKCVTAASSVRHTTPSPHTAEGDGSPGAKQARLSSRQRSECLFVSRSRKHQDK